MKRHLVTTLIFVVALIGASQSYAQVTNYALQLSPQSRIETLRPLEVEEGAPYTVQLSIKCDQWQQGGLLLSLGDFSIQQSAMVGSLEVTTPRGYSHTLTHSSLGEDWSQLSFVATQGQFEIWVNGTLWDSYVGDYRWSEECGSLRLGGGFAGAIDELRIFNTAVNPQDMSHFNTISKYHPNWPELLLYYKFDQMESRDHIVDHRGDNNGRAVDSELRRIVNSDFKSRYMVVSGYSSFIRHNDRPNIDKEMHLMTNDLIMLDAIVDGDSGRIYMQSGENGDLSQGATYSDHIDGRSGVLTLDGQGSLSFCDNSHEDLYYLGNALNVSAWLRLDEVSEEATLYKKFVSSSDQVSIALTSRGVSVSVDGGSVTFAGLLPKVGEWQHVAVNIAPGERHTEVSLYFDNRLAARRRIKQCAKIDDMEAITHIGQGLVGALDNVVVAAISRSDFVEYMSGQSSDFNFPGGGGSASVVLGAWFFESEQLAGRNTASWQSKIENIRKIYEGYEGYKIRFGIITHTKDESGTKVWSKSILSPEWRDALSHDVARIAKHFDGVDIDFEWLDNNPNNKAWQAYGQLIVSLRKAIGEAKVLSASLHPVSYTLPLDSSVIDCVDYITVQNYGPRHTYLKMDRYEKFFDDALKYGIAAQKLSLSMATLIVRSDNSGVNVCGYKDLDFEGFTASTNQLMFRGVPYTFNSPDEVKRKMEFLRERGSYGCMYFDMGNDLKVDHPYSLIRALNSVIASNVERVTQ